MTAVHSSLSKSWVFSPTENSPLSPEIVQLRAEGQPEISRPIAIAKDGEQVEADTEREAEEEEEEEDDEGEEEEEDVSTPRPLARAILVDRS